LDVNSLRERRMAWQKQQLSMGNTHVDSYVVRIYRRTTGRHGGSGTLVGLVEDVHADSERHPFHSMSELWDILDASGVTTPAVHHGQPPPSDHGGHSS
jgi:hypothetical protein